MIGQAPLTVSFDGSGSYDVEGPIAKYEWDFDNKGTIDANGATANRPYTPRALTRPGLLSRTVPV